jgi:hypothetical protein
MSAGRMRMLDKYMHGNSDHVPAVCQRSLSASAQRLCEAPIASPTDAKCITDHTAQSPAAASDYMAQQQHGVDFGGKRLCEISGQHQLVPVDQAASHAALLYSVQSHSADQQPPRCNFPDLTVNCASCVGVVMPVIHKCCHLYRDSSLNDATVQVHLAVQPSSCLPFNQRLSQHGRMPEQLGGGEAQRTTSWSEQGPIVPSEERASEERGHCSGEAWVPSHGRHCSCGGSMEAGGRGGDRRGLRCPLRKSGCSEIQPCGAHAPARHGPRAQTPGSKNGLQRPWQSLLHR